MAYGTVNVGEKVTLSELGGVPSSRKVNNKPLSSDITLAASDVGAVPTTRKVNNKALSADISLTAGDVGAAASSHNHSAANITSGTLAIARGGTGATSAAAARTALGAAASSHNHSAANITSGTLAVARGGTGATSLSSITVGAANKCNGLTFAIAATNPGAAANNKVYFVYYSTPDK